VAIGPILMGLDQAGAHPDAGLVHRRRVVNMTAIAAVEAQIRAAMTTAASGK
jgi:malate dehydrogenase (oxaloacetate-decarboxylating)(NADP+)